MKKKNRIRKNQDFRKIFFCKERFIIKSDELFIFCCQNNLPYTRFGISIGFKVNSVFRHKYKRQINAMLNELKLKLNKNLDLIILIKKKFENNDYQKNFQILKKCLKKIYDDKN